MVPFGSSKGPLQITNLHCTPTIDPSCHKQMIYLVPQRMANYSNGHSSDTGTPPKNCFINLHFITPLCQFMAQILKSGRGQKH